MMAPGGYARTTFMPQGRLHRYIMGNPPKGIDVDHINGDRLDNRKENLRLVTRSENLKNRCKPSRGAPFLGVSLHKSYGKYEAYITLPGRKKLRIGFYDDPEAANVARLLKEKELWGIQPRRLQAFIDAGLAEAA